MNCYGFLADVLVVIHLSFVAFVVVAQLLILLGLVRDWKWVRNAWFRTTHLAAISIVAIEGIFGWACPLTTWEQQLRHLAGQPVEQATFMGRLANHLLFYPVPQVYFDAGHVAFGALVLFTFLMVPPTFRRPPSPLRGGPAPLPVPRSVVLPPPAPAPAQAAHADREHVMAIS